MTTRDEYVTKVKAQLDDMNAQIDKLADKSKSAEKSIQAKYKKQMAEKKVQAKKANAQLDELKASGEHSWQALVAEMDKIGNALKHSYNYFKSQI